MPANLLLPLDLIKPQEILSQYSDWIYFALVLFFFISLAGIAFRRYFDSPFARPLIVVVGILLTVVVFKNRQSLTLIFDGWGSIGSILLVCVVAVIPFGLARGFGLPTGKAFWITFALFYMIAWFHFPSFFQQTASSNLGFINLVLVVLFFVALWQIFQFRTKSKPFIRGSPKGWTSVERQEPEWEREVRTDDEEMKGVRKQAIPLTVKELASIEAAEKALDEMYELIEKHGHGLEREDREKMAKILDTALANERLFKSGLERLKTLFQRLGVTDVKQIEEKKKRLRQVTGQEQEVLKIEIECMEERLKMEQTVRELEMRMSHDIESFERQLGNCIGVLRKSPYPNDALHPLGEARKMLKDIRTAVATIKRLEQRFVALVSKEKGLVVKERKVA